MIVLLGVMGLALAEPPSGVEGRYDVVEMSEAGGEMEEFVDKMRRRALAMGQDCFVSRRTYDFGPVKEGERPSRVAITEQVTCKKGGLGIYYAQATLEVEATWTDGDPAKLEVGGGTSWTAMTRLQKPRDVGVPAQWAAPEHQWVLEPSAYEVAAEKVWGREVPPLVLVEGTANYRLKPVDADGSERTPKKQ